MKENDGPALLVITAQAAYVGPVPYRRAFNLDRVRSQISSLDHSLCNLPRGSCGSKEISYLYLPPFL
jgi:hypothetical protein